MVKSTPFLYQKRGVFYLQKRVPKKLVPKVGRTLVRVSLRTKDRTTAIQTAGSILSALDEEIARLGSGFKLQCCTSLSAK